MAPALPALVVPVRARHVASPSLPVVNPLYRVSMLGFDRSWLIF
ncbi:hypothetical protein [Alloactinosynnema sp. L-07]|nr:hypothetical protein [Alloactinosynnema sp. L-07]